MSETDSEAQSEDQTDESTSSESGDSGSSDSGSSNSSPTDSGNTSSDSSGSSADSDDDSVGISDDQLPEDLQPTDDNPLAKPPSDEDDEDSGMSLGPDGPGDEAAGGQEGAPPG